LNANEHAYMYGCRKNIFLGSNSGFSRGELLKSIFFRNATVVKFHFKNVKVRERHFCNKKRLNESFKISISRVARLFSVPLRMTTSTMKPH